MSDHYCESTSPLARRFGIPVGSTSLTSHVLHEDGTRCFNPTYFRDMPIKPTRPWGDKPPRPLEPPS